MNIQTIQNGSDLLQLYAPLNLHLKPQANVSITISLPSSVGSSAKSISNFDVMDKLRQMVLPDSFSLLKVSRLNIADHFVQHSIHSRCQNPQSSRSSLKASSMTETSWKMSSHGLMDAKSSSMDSPSTHKSKRWRWNASSRLDTTGIRSSAMLKTWTRWRQANDLTRCSYQIFPSNGSAQGIRKT